MVIASGLQSAAKDNAAFGEVLQVQGSPVTGCFEHYANEKGKGDEEEEKQAQQLGGPKVQRQATKMSGLVGESCPTPWAREV